MTNDSTMETQHRPCRSDAGIWRFGLFAMAATWLLWIEHHAPLASMLCGALAVACVTGRRLLQAGHAEADDALGDDGAGAEGLR